ncbi:MAG: TrkH family potassium uptake protein [Ruminiclostridium sp.]|nr:TrkH family potassium uptake protein [Ruminiclostridium sp.]
MNYSMILYLLGWILNFEAIFLTVPAVTALVYSEKEGFSFLIVIGICLLLGLAITFRKPKRKSIYAREGFVIVALSWITLSIFGALPLYFSGTASYIDALFEIVSGITTTGATIFSDVESLPKCVLMWRSFTHWIGGMGVLVFIMAFLPLSGAQNMNLMRAESPGPSVTKLVPRVKNTALVLYAMYFGLTVLMFVFLVAGGNPIFDSINMSFATAGTGGFGIKNNSLAGYSDYTQIVVTVFMILFGVNFSFYFLLITRKFRDAFRISEVRAYLLIILAAVFLITMNIGDSFATLGEAVKHITFTVASIITTTGFMTVDFNLWPELSRTIIVLLIFVGACAGSTGGGMKISRFIILFKSITKEIRMLIHPNQVRKLEMDGRTIEHSVIRTTNVYLVSYMIIFVVSLLLISFDNHSLVTNFTAIATTINNVGPGLDQVGPVSNFGFFSDTSKLILIFDMLAGRLEIFPMLLLFSPVTWKK